MEKARKMHQKCLSFLGSMEDIGKHLDKAKRAHGTAFGQLSEGKGNLISQLNEMEQLGVSSKKISFKTVIGSQNNETKDD
jgi:DNA recombination protein RmuC